VSHKDVCTLLCEYDIIDYYNEERRGTYLILNSQQSLTSLRISPNHYVKWCTSFIVSTNNKDIS